MRDGRTDGRKDGRSNRRTGGRTAKKGGFRLGKPLLPIDKTADGTRAVWLDTQLKVKDIIDFLKVRGSHTL